MSIVIDLTQDDEKFVSTAARKEGVNPTTYLTNLIHRYLLQQKMKPDITRSPHVDWQATQRVGNLHPGNFQMSDDFDDPLPDEFWLGEA